MHGFVTFPTLAVALLSALPASQAAFYSKSSPVMQVNAKNYKDLIAKSNYTAIVEFYAPWCGHCQNLKPAYEKAAKSLDGLAHVAAVDCDDDENKPLCSSLGIQGFPTLKVVRPGKKGKPIVEDYQGPRTASGIVDAVITKINNHVTKITDSDAEAFLNKDEDLPKALLFTDKGTISPLLKSVAIDFLGVISVGQVRSKESKTVEKFGVEKFPSLVLLPGGGLDPITYDGELKKGGIVKFLSQAGTPNADPAPASASSKKAPKESKAKKDSKKEKKSAKETRSSSVEEEQATESATTTVQTAPVIVETAIPIPTIHSTEKLSKECLHAKANTCVLAFVPASGDSVKAQKALDTLAELAHKYAQAQRRLFPFYAVPTDGNTGAQGLIKSLDLSSDDVEVIAINARRGWWRKYEGGEFSNAGIESWIDAIRMSEGTKKKLPEGVVAVESATESTTSESTTSESTNTEGEATETAEASESAEEAESTGSTTAEAAKETPTVEIKHEEL